MASGTFNFDYSTDFPIGGDWPGTLPQSPLIDNSVYTESPQSNALVTNNAIGPPKMRPQGTTVSSVVTMDFLMSPAQLAIFKSFYGNTLQGGSLPFTWKGVGDTVPQTYIFQSQNPPTYIPQDQYWQVTITVMRIGS